MIGDRSLTRTWIDGPAVSYGEAPAVAPITAAVYASDPSLPRLPSSIVNYTPSPLSASDWPAPVQFMPVTPPPDG